MPLIGSGERVLILSDRVSTSVPVGADQETPASGRILIFLDSLPTQGLWSRDEFGVVKPLNGGTISDLSWEAVTPFTFPSPSGDITHSGRAAVGHDPSVAMIPDIQFQVDGNTALDGLLYLGVAKEPVLNPALFNLVFSNFDYNGALFAKPDGLPSRQIDAPGLIRKTIPANEMVWAPDGSQYLVFGTFTLELGASLVLNGDADLVVL